MNANHTSIQSNTTSSHTQNTVGYKPYDTVRISVGSTITPDDSEFLIKTPFGRYGYAAITLERLESIMRESFVHLSSELSREAVKDLYLSTGPERVYVPRPGYKVSELHLHPESTPDEIERWYDTIRRIHGPVVETVSFKMCDSCAEIVVQGYTDSIDDTEEHLARVKHIDDSVLPSGHYWLSDTSEIEEDYISDCEGCNCRGVSQTVSAAKNVSRN